MEVGRNMKQEEEFEKKNMMRNMFRRSSSTDHGKQFIDAKQMPVILNQMGQPVDEAHLFKFMHHIDTEHTGVLDFDRFTKVCEKFLKNPAALAKYQGDEFAFKHLISLEDFAAP